MIRRFTNGLMALSLILFMNSCNDDEVSPPPKTTFTVDKTSGLANDTEFTFVIDKVDAKTISILPYGTEKLTLGGQPVTNFVNGKATVKFKYAKVGTFNAVVVTNNATGEGEFANTYSDPIAISITSDKTSLSDFTIEGATDVDVTGSNITVTMPYGTNPATVKPKFTAAAFSTVTVDGTAVTSGSTTVNLSTPKTFRVTANNGTATADYNVTVVVTPVETDRTIASVTPKLGSKGLDDKTVQAYVDNAAKRVVIFDTLSTAARFDTVKIGYELGGSFSNLKYAGKKAAQDFVLNLTTDKTVTVTGQDSVANPTPDSYTVTWASAPKLELAFNGLNPVVEGTTGNFTIGLNVLTGTDIETLVPTATIETNGGATVVSTSTVTLDEDDEEVVTPFVSGVTPVDFTDPVVFRLEVLDSRGFTYYVDYTVTVTVVP
ncbi:MAG TPA: hypothetical protein VGD40_13255 [Chryseosolibacter sp.]